jgi:hypothetical protein
MGRPTKTTPQEMAVAYHLHGGDSPVTACRKARYAPSTIKSRASKIAKSERVQRALQEIARNIKPGELTDLSKGRLKQKLTSGEQNNAEMLKYIRTSLETEGALGGPSELHLHSHQTLPPRVQAMLEEKMAEILKAQQAAERGEVVDAEVVVSMSVVTAPAETPRAAPIQPPDPIQADLDRELEQQTLERWKEDYKRKSVPIWKQKRA